jgi:hypothetical protein
LSTARALTAGALLTLAACSQAAAQEVDIRVPPGERLVFKGVTSFDGAGGHAGGMVYQGGVAGLVVGVITHGTLESTMRRREKDKIEQAADKVLTPYADVLATYKPRELMERAASKMRIGARHNLVDATTKPASATLVESTPVFFLTQDQSAIVLENDVLIYGGTAGSEPSYRNGIRVVSEAKDAADPAAFWLANNGENLKQASAQLMSESLVIALQDASGTFRSGNNAPHRTVRYSEGQLQKMERAQVLSATCDRLLLKTLRESLLAVPIRRDDALRPSSCNSSTQ